MRRCSCAPTASAGDTAAAVIIGMIFARWSRLGLDPDEVTLYALRHSSIVRQLLANVPIRIIATLHDTSVKMIERTYSRHIASHSDDIARRALLETNAQPPAAANVVPLPKGR